MGPVTSAAPTVGLAAAFQHDRNSGFRKYLQLRRDFNTAHLPSMGPPTSRRIHWVQVANDLVEQVALPAGSPPGDYKVRGKLPDTWNLPPQDRDRECLYAVHVGQHGVEAISLSDAPP